MLTEAADNAAVDAAVHAMLCSTMLLEVLIGKAQSTLKLAESLAKKMQQTGASKPWRNLISILGGCQGGRETVAQAVQFVGLLLQASQSAAVCRRNAPVQSSCMMFITLC